MGRLLRSGDRANSPLGAPESWSQGLRTAVRLMLNTRHPVYIFWGPQSLCLYNDAYRATLDSAHHPASLAQPARVVWAEIWDTIGPQIAQVLSGGEPTWHENQPLSMTRDGRRQDIYWTYSYSPIDDDSGAGQVGGVLVLCTETTGQVLAARHASAERGRFAELFSRAPSFMCLLQGPEHRFELANDRFTQLVGRDDLIGKTVARALPDAAAQGFVTLLDKVYATGVPLLAHGVAYAQQISPNGPVDERFVDFVYQPVTAPDGTVSGIFVQGNDITDRASAEKALRESETKLLALNADLENQVTSRTQERARVWQLSPDLIGVVNAQGLLEATNPAWQTVLGWSAAQLASTPFFQFLHPDDVAPNREAFARAIEDGEPAVHLENRYRHVDGGYRWLSWVAIPEDGRVYCSARDITAQKKAAQRLARAEDALRQAQKMEAVGQLTGGLAHDFNNLLAGIMGSLEVVRIKLAQNKPDEVERYLAMGGAAVKRAAALTQRLLAFSRRQSLDPRPIDAAHLVAGMADLIRHTIGPQIALQVHSADVPWVILVDPPQLENALLNLCINARDAMPQGGQLNIGTANVTLDQEEAEAEELPPGDYVALSVTDSGTGMTAQVKARAFDPFYTTKPLGQGTGLGLSMIYGFARQSGGQVRIESVVGRGTTVRLYLPRQNLVAMPPEATSGALPPEPRDQTASILIVDDEAPIRELIGETLTEAGYSILLAGDAAAGLELLGSPARIDLLISDVGLPGSMNGRQMADAARETRPQLKVLFITGFAAAGDTRMGRDMYLLTKPFALHDLATKVRGILAPSTPP